MVHNNKMRIILLTLLSINTYVLKAIPIIKLHAC